MAQPTPTYALDDPRLKERFRREWNLESRVGNFVAVVALQEFGDGPCRDAWRQALAGAIPSGRCLRVLDVGTGPGVFAQLYAEMGHTVTGLDFSERMLRSAESLAAERGLSCCFVHGDAESPPFPPGSFDVVSSRNLLFNLPHPEQAMERWLQLLVPGGTMVIMGQENRSVSAWQTRLRMGCGRVLATLTGYRDPPVAWKPGDDYMALVRSLPLNRPNQAMMRDLLARHGLPAAQSLDTTRIWRAHRAQWSLTKRLNQGVFSSPYILVARRPTA